MYSTKDVSLAAYIRFKGIPLHGYRVTRSGEGEWEFDITTEDAERLRIQYVNSDISSYEGIRRGMSKQKYG